MSADKWTTFIAHKFQTVISLEIDEFLRISFMFDYQEENGLTMYYVFLLIKSYKETSCFIDGTPSEYKCAKV